MRNAFFDNLMYTQEGILMFQILLPDGSITDRELLLSLGLTGKNLLNLYHWMIVTRIFHEVCKEESEADPRRLTLQIGPKGQEAAEVGSAYALDKRDWIFAYARTQGHWHVREVPLESQFIEFYCYGTPPSFVVEDFTSRDIRLPYTWVGNQIPHAIGAAWAAKMFGDNAVAAAFFGDGATDEGDFHSINWAAIFNIPVILICENNKYAITMPTEVLTAAPFWKKAEAHGIRAVHADGNDVLAMYAVTRSARRMAIEEHKATFIQADTDRQGPHTNAVKDVLPPTQEEMEGWKERDCIQRFERFLASDLARDLYGIVWMPADGLETYQRILGEVRRAARDAYEKAAAILEKAEDLVVQHETIYSSFAPHTVGMFTHTIFRGQKTFERVNPQHAVGLALHDGLPKAVCIGQDIGRVGGVMRTTRLLKEAVRVLYPQYMDMIARQPSLPLQVLYHDRVLDTPVSESDILGIGLGLALKGVVTVAEIQFHEFANIGMHHIDEAARMLQRYAGRISIPFVVRMPFGAGERIEGHNGDDIRRYFNIPGLIIACPSLVVQDWYDMLLASMEAGLPVLFFEHIDLYRSIHGAVTRRSPSKRIEEFGVRVAREGRHLTIVTYGRMVQLCIEAAEESARRHGIEATILDVLVFSPLKKDVIIESVAETGRLLTVEESPKQHGVGAEFAACVAEDPRSFHYLQAPIRRLAGRQCYPPFPRAWKHYIPSVPQIVEAIEEMLEIPRTG